MPFWGYLAVYFGGLIVGTFANTMLNVRLRRPSLAKSIALALLVALVTVFIQTRNTTMPDWLLVLAWSWIGLLAGLGSREARAPL